MAEISLGCTAIGVSSSLFSLSWGVTDSILGIVGSFLPFAGAAPPVLGRLAECLVFSIFSRLSTVCELGLNFSSVMGGSAGGLSGPPPFCELVADCIPLLEGGYN